MHSETRETSNPRKFAWILRCITIVIIAATPGTKYLDKRGLDVPEIDRWAGRSLWSGFEPAIYGIGEISEASRQSSLRAVN